MANRTPRVLARLFLLGILSLAGWCAGLPPTGAAEVWIPAGAVWKYVATGTNLGTAWRGDDYDDSSWLSGPAQLGYGDGDEATVITGGPSGSRYITTYFRHPFTVSAATTITNLTLRLLRDDGAVVYLNGLEVFRSNMPGGTISSFTQASSAVGGADENAFFTAKINHSLLVEGLNALAVEIHQNSPTSSDVSFDLSLEAERIPGPPVILAQPGDQFVLPGGIATFGVTAVGLGPLEYQWQLDGGDIDGATNSVLVIPNVTAASVGSYRVLVRNPLGENLSARAVLELAELTPETFQIAELSATGALAIEHGSTTGDDRGGIATSFFRVFVTGDSATGAFDLEDLANPASVPGPRLDALVGDLRSERVYVLANGATPLDSSGLVTSLVEIDDITGLTTTNRVPLSSPIAMNFDSGIFASYGAVVLHNGSRVYRIELPSGQVTDLGAMNRPSHSSTENWAYWGVAEFVAGTVHLVYVRDQGTIVRTRVPDGFTTAVAQFNSLSDMASITVSVPSQRWYFHHEGSSQFRSGDETVGYADARFIFAPRDEPPVIRRQPANVFAAEGSTATFDVSVRETGPVTYQWKFNGMDLPGANSNRLSLFQVTTNVAGTYSVVASNAFGAITSTPATLHVLRRALVAVFDDPIFVDTAGQPWSESDNLQESMRRSGYAVATFTSILQATTENNVLAFPRFEYGDVAAFLDDQTRNALRTFVSQGGLLLVSGTPDDPGRNERFLNTTFGFALSAGNASGGTTYQRGADAAGTSFAVGPAAIPFNFNLVHLVPSSLPPGSRDLYQGDGGSAVSMIPYGEGRIVFLGWDWDNAQPAGTQDGGWMQVLALAVQESQPLAPSAPEILVQPEGATVLVGGRLNLDTLAFGSVPLFYQWQRDGVDLPGATNQFLLMTGVTSNQSGNYRVVVTNALGSATSSNALVQVVELEGDSFQITSLSSSGAFAVEHNQITGDDRGGIAISADRVFHTGDSGSGSFHPDTLEGAPTPFQYDGLVGDLRTAMVYTFGVGNRPMLGWETRITTLLEIDDLTGGLTGERIDLSTPIDLELSFDQVGVFAGYGRIVIYNGTRLHHISLPSGQVIDLGDAQPLAHAYSENWAYWGVAEFHDGIIHLVYVGTSGDVMRTRVTDWSTTVVGDFENLSDMASITVSVSRNRWYFHHEGTSQFHSGDETIGYANATFAIVSQPAPPEIVRQPASRTVLEGEVVVFPVTATGALPLQYQWRFNEEPIQAATNRTYSLTATFGNEGRYDVMVSNAFGVATSEPVTLVVRPSRGVVGIFVDQGLPSAGAAAAVLSAGFTPRHLLDLAGADLGGLSLLIVQAVNSQLSDLLQARLPAIREWVEGGGRLIVHRHGLNQGIPAPDPLLLGTPGTLVDPNLGFGIEALANTLVTSGPHGTISGEVLTNWVYAGHIIRPTLPPHAVPILGGIDTVDSNKVAAASYTLGAGGVYYSTIPLEFFLQNPDDTSLVHREVYAPNVVEYMSALVPAGSVVVFSAPAPQTALAGTAVSFEVSASGAPPLTYQWQFNGEDLPGATDYRLQLTNVSATEAGTYRVRINNSFGSVTTAEVPLSLITPSPFRIVNLLSTGSRVVEHDSVTGDDRGGIAASATHLFYSGDNRTGRFLLGDLSGGTALPQVYDALVSDLKTERIYSLANDTNMVAGGSLVTALLEINGTTAAPTTNVVRLSSPILMGFDNGMFAGYGAVVLHNGSRVYRIELPSGTVTDLGQMIMPAHSNCENWAFWGVAEFHGGAVHLVYVRDSQTIVRTRVPDGQTTTVAAFSSLSDMCSFTVSVSRNRWYFHHEGSSQFGGTSETIGYSSAVFDRPPALPLLADQSVPEDTLSPVMQFTMSDPETPAGSLILRVDSSNTNLLPRTNLVLGGSGGVRTLQFRGAANQSGTATVTVTVTDSIGATVSRSFVVTVIPVNDPPDFQPGPDVFALEDAGAQTIAGWAAEVVSGPPDEATQALEFEVSSDNPGLFLEPPRLDPAGTLTYTPAPQAYGLAVVAAILRDDGGTSASGLNSSPPRTFTITVAPVNDPPAFVGGPDVLVREDAGLQTFASWATLMIAGPPNEASQALVFSVGTDNSGLFVVSPAIAPDGTLTFTPAPGAHGSASLTAILHDDGGTENNGTSGSAPRVFTITVMSVNDAPSFIKGPDLTLDEDAGARTIAGWATAIRPGPPDESAQALQFLVTNDNPDLFSTPPSLAIDGTLSFRPAANAHGSATVRVLLRDDGGTSGGGVDASAPETFRIVIRPANDTPVAHPQALTATEDASLAFALTASDVDGDSLTYILVSQPAHGTLSGDAPNLSYKPVADYSGPDQFQFKVLDGSTESGVATVSITVVPVNDPPVARALLRPTSSLFPDAEHLVVIAFDGLSATVILDGTMSSDPENDPLEYYWLDSGGVAIGGGALSTNILSLGSHTITLLVDDGTDTATAVLEVEVVSAAEAAEGLALMVYQADFGRQNKRPMIATLKAIAASFDRRKPIEAINQLNAFQNKVRAQLERTQPELAEELIRAAQELIDLAD